MKNSKILLISDFVGIGKVALSAMSPILSTMKADISYLPTAMISNNFDYGEAAIKDLTDFMEDSKEIWKRLNLQFEIIVTGIVMNTNQVNTIKDIVAYHDKKPLVVSDPIMGDHGEFYKGLSADLVKASQLLALEADIIIPNLTEFSFILEEKYPNPNELTHDKLIYWLKKAKSKGIKSAVITSVQIGDEYYVYGYSQNEDIFRVKIEYVPVEVGGAGDIFTSLFIGSYIQTNNLEEATKYTTKILTNIIKKECGNKKIAKKQEIKIQNYLQDIYESL